MADMQDDTRLEQPEATKPLPHSRSKRSGKSAKAYRLERDAALHQLGLLQARYNALIMKRNPEKVVVRVDTSQWETGNSLLDYLFDTKQFAGMRMSNDDSHIDVIGLSRPELQWRVTDLPTEGFTPPQGDLEAQPKTPTNTHTSKGGLG